MVHISMLKSMECLGILLYDVLKTPPVLLNKPAVHGTQPRCHGVNIDTENKQLDKATPIADTTTTPFKGHTRAFTAATP
jgi:hypothetical protein